MKRNLYKNLLAWKNNKNRKPLLLTGARQVGKTYLLNEFANNEYNDFIYLNLDKEKERYESVFENSIAPEDIISRLEIITGRKITPYNTLIIFDEVQEIPRALTSLKYFYEDAPEYHIAASGSQLGIALHPGTSFPVGKVDILELEPLTFDEYLIATGNERFLGSLKNEEDLETFSDTLKGLFREYLIVGGMPEVVANWLEKRDLEEVDRAQNAILLAYSDDISKHTDSTTAMRIHQVIDSLPAQFAKRNEKFVFNVVKGGARAREYELAIQWLIDCKIVRRVNRLKVGDKLPLKAYADLSSFKLYFIDVGLFRKLADVKTEAVMNDELLFKEFNGFFAEQFVLQQVAKTANLFYWSSDATAEVDFVMNIGTNIVPIEVKSGNNVKAKSLRIFRGIYNPKLSLRYSLRPPEYNDGLLNLPLYSAGLANDLIQKYLAI